MLARAAVRAVSRGGVTVLDELRSEAPLGLFPGRSGHAGTVQAWLVGSAGGPLGGDDLELRIEVGDGASLAVGSVAATVALAGDAPSTVRVHAVIGRGGCLTWAPEPLIVTGRADHRMEVHLDVAAGASVWWRDELVLGRFLGRQAEPPGRCTLSHRAELGGAPWLRHDLAVGAPGWDGGAVLGTHRCVGSVLTTDGSAAAPVDGSAAAPVDGSAGSRVDPASGEASRLDLDAGGSLTVALAPDRPSLARLLPCPPDLAPRRPHVSHAFA